jgi:hypothetical protein
MTHLLGKLEDLAENYQLSRQCLAFKNFREYDLTEQPVQKVQDSAKNDHKKLSTAHLPRKFGMSGELHQRPQQRLQFD